MKEQIVSKVVNSADCVLVKVYSLRPYCERCDFNCDVVGHYTKCEFTDENAVCYGKPLCRYVVDDEFVSADQLKGDECVSFVEARMQKAHFDYIHACAVKVFRGESLNDEETDPLVEFIEQLSLQEAEVVVKANRN